MRHKLKYEKVQMIARIQVALIRGMSTTMYVEWKHNVLPAENGAPGSMHL